MFLKKRISKIIPSFFTIKEGIFLPLRLSCKESSTFLTKPLFPQGREDVAYVWPHLSLPSGRVLTLYPSPTSLP